MYNKPVSVVKIKRSDTRTYAAEQEVQAVNINAVQLSEHLQEAYGTADSHKGQLEIKARLSLMQSARSSRRNSLKSATVTN